MIAHCTESAYDALQELAGWLVRDVIDADHLEVYMSQLLHRELVELHASCRFQAMEVIREGVKLDDAGIASRLCSVADGIENGDCLNGLGRSGEHLLYFSLVQSRAALIDSAKPGSDHASTLNNGPLSSLSEAVGAVTFITIALFLMHSDYGEFSLRVMAATLYGLVGVTHAAVAIHSAWRRHANRRTAIN